MTGHAYKTYIYIYVLYIHVHMHINIYNTHLIYTVYIHIYIYVTTSSSVSRYTYIFAHCMKHRLRHEINSKPGWFRATGTIWIDRWLLDMGNPQSSPARSQVWSFWSASWWWRSHVFSEFLVKDLQKVFLNKSMWGHGAVSWCEKDDSGGIEMARRMWFLWGQLCWRQMWE